MTFRRGGIYRRRFQIWYPWSITCWWLPRVFRGGDEWCNDSIGLIAGFALVIFWRSGPLRTLPCSEEWELMGGDERADYAPCGYLYNGHIHDDAHQHWDTGICPDAEQWLSTKQHLAQLQKRPR